jgi:hypothetical protein
LSAGCIRYWLGTCRTRWGLGAAQRIVADDQLLVLCSLRMRPVPGFDIARRKAYATSAAGTGVNPGKYG